MKFRYFKFPLEKRSTVFGSSILKPIIPIVISKEKEKVQYAALIDSGADFCIFDAEIAETLNIKLKKGTRIPFGGIQERGGASAYLHEINLTIVVMSFALSSDFPLILQNMVTGS